MQERNEISETGHALSKVKLISLGNGAVGKTSILRCYAGMRFETQHLKTYGVQFYKAKYQHPRSSGPVEVQLWDTAGQENFRSIVRSFYKKCDGVLLCYDVSNRESFDSIQGWIQEIHNNTSQDVPITLIGNKIDLPQQQHQITLKEANKLAKRFKAKHFRTSAKAGEGVDQAVNHLVDLVYASNEMKLRSTSISGVTISRPSGCRTKDCKC